MSGEAAVGYGFCFLLVCCGLAILIGVTYECFIKPWRNK